MLNYYSYFENNDGVRYKIDMIRFKFYCDDSKMKLIHDFINMVSDFDIYQSAKAFAYSVLFKVYIKNSTSSFSIGLGFNGLRSADKNSCFIEFNPNRVGKSIELTRVLDYMAYLNIAFDISLYDIAIDIPIFKKYVSLIKDKRVYRKFVYDCEGVNVTEYLGSTSDYGRVKLYNKTIESELDYNLTRLELTTNSSDFAVISRQLPQLLVCGSLNLFDDSKLTKSDFVLLQLLWLSGDASFYFKQLWKDKQLKLSSYINSSFNLGFNEEVFKFLMQIIEKFKNFLKK